MDEPSCDFGCTYARQVLERLRNGNSPRTLDEQQAQTEALAHAQRSGQAANADLTPDLVRDGTRVRG